MPQGETCLPSSRSTGGRTLGGAPEPPERSLVDRMADLEFKFQEAMATITKAHEELSFRIIELERKVG